MTVIDFRIILCYTDYMIIDIISEAIRQNIGPLKQAPKGWQKTCCRLCHTRGHNKDTRNRFGIQFNQTSIATNCFNCGFSASYTDGKELSKSFKIFLKNLQLDDKFISQLEFQIFKQKNQIQHLRDGDEDNEIDLENKFRSLFSKWKPIDLPEDALSLHNWIEYGLDNHDFLDVVDYAINRKLNDLTQFYWSPSKENNLNNRLIIPYFYKRKIVGFASRLSFNVPDKSIPKYFQVCPTDFVYNLDNQQEINRKHVIVTEGILDAWVTDGVSILGEIGQNKIDIINRLQKNVIVCPDRDKKGYDLVKAAIENGWAVSFPKWNNDIKDAAAASEKYGKLLTVQSIISSIVYGKEKIKINWEIEQNERQRKRN